MTEGAVRIAMWSGPRNISTTMMRAFDNRADTAVVDEPFYAAYLLASGADHPYRNETLAAQPLTVPAVLRALARPLSEFGKPDAHALFLKIIAYHLPDDADLAFALGWRNFLLIRDPARMIASYLAKKGDVAPVVRSYAVSRRLHALLTERGLPCPVVDAADILADPPGILSRLCAALGVDFSPAMLRWPAGPRESDGPWAPHWYDAVRASTGFGPPVETSVSLSDDARRAAASCRQDYDFLHERRLR